MSAEQNTTAATAEVLEQEPSAGVYASLLKKINLSPVEQLNDISAWKDEADMAEAGANQRVTAALGVFLEQLRQSGTRKVDKLDKALLDQMIGELDRQLSQDLDKILHHPEFQKVESLWRGVEHLVDKSDFRKNIRVELLDLSKDALREDFEDAPEIIQSGLYQHAYVNEYDTPGGEPIAALISAYEFDASSQDIALLRNISKVAAAVHWLGGPGVLHEKHDR